MIITILNKNILISNSLTKSYFSESKGKTY